MLKASSALLMACLALALTACPKPLPPPPPPVEPRPPPAPSKMLPEDGVQLGLDYCRNQGFTCEIKDVSFLPGSAVKVNLIVNAPMKGTVTLDYDAVTHKMKGMTQTLTAP